MKIFRYINTLFSAVVLAAGLTSCLDSGDEAETVITNYYNAIVTGFSLEANTDVCANLSSYKFTIDNYGLSDPEIHAQYPDDGIIFNADSLPVGSIPDSVKVSLSFSSPDSVYFRLYEPWGKLGQYSTYSKDSALYFASYPDSRLTLVSAGGYRKTYHIKVNVHRVKGDTIQWHDYTDELWADMAITDQRTDTLDGQYCWYVEENGMQTQVSTSPISGDCRTWSAMRRVVVAGGDVLDLASLYHWHGALYAVGKTSGHLFRSTDGVNWTTCASDYSIVSVLGNQCRTQDVFGRWNSDSLNVIVRLDGQLRFATTADARHWTLHQAVPAGFPVRGFSRPISTEARSQYGNLTSRLYLTGGETADGQLVAGTWSCDGWNEDDRDINWECFEQNEMPAMTGATVIEYTFDASKPKSLWLLQPGLNASGSVPANTFYGQLHATLYYSEDHGVSWHRLNRYYGQYADNLPIGLVSCNSGFCSDGGYQLRYFGGRRSDGTFKTSVWGGQLNSLTFVPKK